MPRIAYSNGDHGANDCDDSDNDLMIFLRRPLGIDCALALALDHPNVVAKKVTFCDHCVCYRYCCHRRRPGRQRHPQQNQTDSVDTKMIQLNLR